MKKLIIFLLLPLYAWGQTSDANLKSVQIDPKIRNITTASGITKGNVSDVLQAIVDSKISRIEACSTSGTNTYTVTVPWATSYVLNMEITLFVGNANTGASTINVNSFGAKTVLLQSGSALSGSELKGFVKILYNGAAFQILGGSGSVAAATPTTAGITKLYTATGSNTDGAMDQNSITTALSGKLGATASAGGDLSGNYPNPTVSKVNGSAWPANSSGFLQNNGSGTLSWANATGLSITAEKSSNYGVQPREYVPVDLSGGSLSFTIPVAPADGTIVGVEIVKLSGSNNLTIVTGGSDHFNTTSGATGLVLSVLGQIHIYQYRAANSVWYIINNDATQLLSGFATGIVKSETTTGKLSIASSGDFPTLNQNTTGSAAKWTTARNLAGNSVDGSSDVLFSNKFIVQGTTDTGLSSAQFLGALGTGIVKNTTTTGVLNIAVAGDFPTLNQNTTGSAATLTTGRTISITGDLAYTSSSFDGSGNVTAAGTLATVNSNTGTFGSSTQVGTFTVNGKGLITAASNVTVTPDVGSITGLGTGVATWLATPSWTNFNSAITGTAPYWALTGTSTTTGAVTISSTTPSGLNYSNTWTSTANNQNSVEHSGTLTSRNTNGDVLNGFVIDHTLARNAGNPTTQTANAVLVNPTFSNTFATQNIFKLQNAGSDRWVINSDGTINQTLGANNITGLVMKRSTDTSPTGKFLDFQNAAGSSVFSIDIVGAISTTQGIGSNQISAVNSSSTLGLVGGASTSQTIIINSTGDYTSGTRILVDILNAGLRGYAFSSGTNSGTTMRFAPKINNTGGTNTVIGIDYVPNETSLTGTTHYFYRSASTTALSGLAKSAPTSYLDIGAGTTTIAPFGLTSGTDLTSPVNGKMEYDGINLKFTPASTTRKIVSLYNATRSTAQTAAVASVATWTVGANDGSFLVSANVNLTASTTNSFTVTCTYTDETNTSRTDTFSFVQNGVAVPLQTITDVTGVGAYSSMPLHIRCKASTSITIATTGTFTSVTYNVEGAIAQIN